MTLPANRKTPFFDVFYHHVQMFGGLFNAHLHLDRANTLKLSATGGDGASYSAAIHVSLHEKHRRIADIHSGADYDLPALDARVRDCVEAMIACGTRRADTMVDVTPDRVGLSALETLARIKADMADRIEINLAAYTPFGFSDGAPEHWALMERAAETADFLGFLPEADDHSEYPDHIGFSEHCRRGLSLGLRHGKMIHVHLDQRNEPSERGLETLLEVMETTPGPSSDSGETMVWGVHVISPTTYDEDRFQQVLEKTARLGVGIICCPTAALGMRQLRPVATPTDNSFPRVLDFVAAGVPVRIGCDNIGDACSPSTTPDLVDEVIALSSACRFYDPLILAKIACGVMLADEDRDVVTAHLAANGREVDKTVAFLKNRGAAG